MEKTELKFIDLFVKRGVGGVLEKARGLFSAYPYLNKTNDVVKHSNINSLYFGN